MSDTALLQSLLNSRGPVSLEPRVYALSAPLTFTGLRDVVLDGGGSTLKASDTQTIEDTTGETVQLTGCQNVVFRNWKIDGNAPNRGNGSQQVGATSFPAGSVVLRGCAGIIIESNVFQNSVMDDVCILSGTEANGATLTSACQSILIRSNIFFGPASRQQISAVSVVHLRVVDNYFANHRAAAPFGQCIDVEANPQDALGTLADIEIQGNRFFNCRLGVIVNSKNAPKYVMALWNVMRSVDIGVSNWADGTLIKGNTIFDAANIGIGAGVIDPLDGSPTGAAVILDNEVFNCPTPIYLDAVKTHKVGRNIGAITTTPSGGYVDLGGNAV